LKRVSYSQVELDHSEDYLTLQNDIRKLQEPDSQIIFYLAISPDYFHAFIDNYKQLDLQNVKVIFEKPFGRDLETARALNAKI
jgi:glucose-6-phosphate 1-dehydrogenase